MKDNTGRAKQLVSQAMREMPQDFALSEARFHLQAALSVIEKVENRRQQRHQQEKKQYEQTWGTGQPIVNIRETINAIDDMIEKEKQKLQEIADRRKKRQSPVEEDDEPLLG